MFTKLPKSDDAVVCDYKTGRDWVHAVVCGNKTGDRERDRGLATFARNGLNKTN